MMKTTFAASYANYLKTRSRLLAVYFCHFGNMIRNNPVHLIRSIAYQIAENMPASRQHIFAALNSGSYLEDEPVSNLFREIIVKPLTKCPPPSLNMVIVIDAIDEIDQAKSRSALLDIFSYNVPTEVPSLQSVLPLQLRALAYIWHSRCVKYYYKPTSNLSFVLVTVTLLD